MIHTVDKPQMEAGLDRTAQFSPANLCRWGHLRSQRTTSRTVQQLVSALCGFVVRMLQILIHCLTLHCLSEGTLQADGLKLESECDGMADADPWLKVMITRVGSKIVFASVVKSAEEPKDKITQ